MKHTLTILLALFLCSCGDQKDSSQKEENVSNVLPTQEAIVEVEVLKKSDFHRELISNGKVSANQRADMRFSSNEMVLQIFVSNGDRVTKGQKIAVQDQRKLQNKLSSTKSSLEQSYLSLQDELIGRGYSIKDTASVPPQEMSLLRTKSGYDKAVVEYNTAKLDFQNSVIYAPFTGVVANLFSKEHNQAPSSEPFCTIIADGEFDVAFSILESELSMVKKGAMVEVMPFTNINKKFTGRIIEINPIVDKNGLVQLKASVNSSAKELFDGMNVRVAIANTIADQLVVPKTAVVLRSGGRDVVFTLKNGQAIWNYIEKGEENSTHVIVKEGLKEGDQVIFSGNMNLAHETSVKIK